jgi:hypothetical protein
MLSHVSHTLLIALMGLLLACAPTLAQDVEPFVVVPEHPGGVAVNGCFRANQDLFGPYRLTFCLQRRGTYQVRGGGLSCDGRILWSTSGRDILVDLERSSCGRGRAWEAATMDCRHTGTLGSQIAGRVIGNTRLQALRCTYHPSVRGVSQRTFTANRVR